MLVARLFGMLAVKIGQPRVMGEVVAGHHCSARPSSARCCPSCRRRCSRRTSSRSSGSSANLGLIFYMFLVGLEIDPTPAEGPDRPGRGDLERQRRAADGARHRGGAADLRAGRPRHEVRRVRALHGRGDVDHRLPGAGADPGRAADAQAAGRRARAGVRGDRRRDGVVPDRAGHRGRGGRLGQRGARDDRARDRLLPGDGLRACGRCSPACRPPTTRPGRVPGGLDRGDLRRRPAVRLRDRGDRHRADLRRLRDGPDHAAPRRADRGRDPPDRGLRRHRCCCRCSSPTPACAPTSACSTGPSCGCSRSC